MTVASPVLPESPASLGVLGFRALTNPLGPAVDIEWELSAPDGDPDGPSEPRIQILRRERRYPGTARRGWVPVVATASDLTDGILVLDTAHFTHDFSEIRSEWEDGQLVTTTRQYRYRGTPPDRELVRVIRRTTSAAGTPVSATVRITDRQDLVAGTIYYYTAFVGSSSSYSRATQSSALASGRYGTSMFAALPQADRVRDTTAPAPFTVALADTAKGQLERYVDTVEAHLDLLRGSVSGLQDLHGVRRADARLLPHLAHLVGWQLKDYLDEDAQRVEVGFAAEFYRTVGSSANIGALVNRLTGWDARVREFVRNVLVTFDSTRQQQLASGPVAYLDGSMTGNPAPPPDLFYRTVPPGSVDTSDPLAMYRLRNRLFEDTSVYSYDCGTPTQDGFQRDDSNWYARDTAGIYIVPETDTEVFTLQAEWDRIRQILQDFLPINVRAIFILMPGVVVEQEYDATVMVTEEFADNGVLQQDELYGEGEDSATDRIPRWRHFITNSLVYRSVDVTAVPVDTTSRTWHTGLS
jgi:hypothetical protein